MDDGSGANSYKKHFLAADTEVSQDSSLQTPQSR